MTEVVLYAYDARDGEWEVTVSVGPLYRGNRRGPPDTWEPSDQEIEIVSAVGEDGRELCGTYAEEGLALRGVDVDALMDEAPEAACEW